MKSTQLILIGLILIFTGACAMSPESEVSPDVLMEADRAFERATTEQGVDGWVSHFADDGVVYPKQGVVEGVEAIREMMTPVFADDGPGLTWRPTRADVAASGDLGYTIGRWESGSEDGESAVTRGNYVTIWRKEPDGRWKVVVDIGNDDPIR